MNSDQKAAREAARAGAAVVRNGFLTRPEVRMKGTVDPVTTVDHHSEEAVFETLSRLYPGEEILGEESGGAGWDSERIWIVDPLDGTVNFIHGLPHVSVSVAVWERGAPVAGAVIDVMNGEEFTATAGGGAYLEDRPIQVSETDKMAAALLVTGFPYDRQDHAHAYARVMAEVLTRVQGVRRLGSAALDLAWVACGRFDGYWEYSLGPWDTAAGALLVTEAGGTLTDHTGAPYDPACRAVVATNGRLHAMLQDLVGRHLPEHLR